MSGVWVECGWSAGVILNECNFNLFSIFVKLKSCKFVIVLFCCCCCCCCCCVCVCVCVWFLCLFCLFCFVLFCVCVCVCMAFVLFFVCGFSPFSSSSELTLSILM